MSSEVLATPKGRGIKEKIILHQKENRFASRKIKSRKEGGKEGRKEAGNEGRHQGSQEGRNKEALSVNSSI